MSKMAKEVKSFKVNEKMNEVINYMGGTSYKVNPLDTLKMVTASSIFGEPQYYRKGEFAKKGVVDGIIVIDKLFSGYSLFTADLCGIKTSEFMEKVIDEALDYDFEGTVKWAKTLRTEFLMRLNPQVIMVRASKHPARVEFNEKHPGVFSSVNESVMQRADEPAMQLTYYLYSNGNKSAIPSVLKRNWAARLEKAGRYELAKYKNAEVGMINTVRICHANSPLIDELMQTGTIAVSEDEKTWENLKSAGASWQEILATCKLGHMALLRNLRGIFTEIDNYELCKTLLEQLKSGVLKGKQFPFRYWSAYKMISNSKEIHHRTLILDALEECIDISCQNMPSLKGKTMCLSDNSGSAWGTFNSEYGSVTVAEIDNLSSIIAARNSDEGYVGKFGDKLKVFPASKRNGVLDQLKDICNGSDNDIGGATENGIWLFFKKAIENKEHWDNIFIYSDMQAGHGGLYGTYEESKIYSKKGFACGSGYRSSYINVAKLADYYRKHVNPKVNIFSVQTAGYDNVVIPEYGYRTNLMYGWTGKELLMAKTMIDLWDNIEAKKES